MEKESLEPEMVWGSTSVRQKGDKDMTQNIFVGVMFAAVIIVSGLVWWYENSSTAKKEDTQGETDEKHSIE